MLQLRSNQICDEFKVNKQMYSNYISQQDEKRLEYIEGIISSRKCEFLCDPDYWIELWEAITGEDIPSKYVATLPREITGTNAKLTKHSKTYYFYKFLPVVNRKGDQICYPEDRQVLNHKQVYILKDDLMEDLVVA